MLQGYEKETAPLNAYEQKVLLPQLLRGLSRKHGKANKITSGKIIEGMRDHGYKLDAPRLRKIINHIRVNGLLHWLIATSKGYYIATSRQEMEDYIDSLRGREQAIRAVRESMEKQLMN